MTGKTKMEKTWGAERGTDIHDRALKAVKAKLNAKGYAVVLDNGFECAAGAVDLIAKSDWDLAFVDVYVNNDPATEDFPAPHGRRDLGKIEAAFRAMLREADPLAWNTIPSGRSYFQFHLNAVSEDRAVMRSSECPIVGGIARFESEENSSSQADSVGACADEQALLAATHFLERRGWEIIAAEGFECKAGAIDLIAEDDRGDIVLVKVSAWDSGIGEQKKPSPGRHWFEKVLNAFCKKHAELTNKRMRFDLIDVIRVGGGKALVRHHVDAHGC